MLATIVDWNALGKVVLYGLVSSLALTGLMSVAIAAGARADDLRRDRAAGLATVFGAVAVVAVVIFLAGIVIGVTVMLKK